MTNSRAAGKRGERKARDKWRELYPDTRRGVSQSAGALEADLEGLPVAVEVKEWKRWPDVEAALAQIKLDCAKRRDLRPECVMHRRKNADPKKRTGWRVTFDWDEFVSFVEEVRREDW